MAALELEVELREGSDSGSETEAGEDGVVENELEGLRDEQWSLPLVLRDNEWWRWAGRGEVETPAAI